MKKIISLSKVLCKEYFSELPIFKRKIENKGFIYTACVLILIISLSMLSHDIIDFLRKTTNPEIFLNIYLLILAIILIFQQILASTNIYYFSKDLEYIIPFPIKPVELLIGRFSVLLSIAYISTFLFGFIPILMYGLMVERTLVYYIGMIIILLIFPIIFSLVVSIIMLFLMQLSKIIKNKDIFQFIITIGLMIIISILEILIMNNILSNTEYIRQIQQQESINLIEVINNKVKEINNYFLVINPSVTMLLSNSFFKLFLEILKIILFNLIFLIIFLFTGKILYLKNILKNIEKINNNKIKKTKIKKINKRNSIKKAYIKQEFRELIKNPTYFMQCIIPSIIALISICALVMILYPVFLEMMKSEDFSELVQQLEFNIEAICIILSIIQIIFTFSNLSITVISRKGKNANFIKYIPVSLYKQFLYLNVPQIMFNTISCIVILAVAKYLIPIISLPHLIAIFIISILINIINSFLMVIVDLRKPNLNWNNETEAIKQNKNKLFQYVLTILIILVLSYLSKILIDINLNLAIILIIIIFTIILLLINKLIKIKLQKLFEKIF